MQLAERHLRQDSLSHLQRHLEVELLVHGLQAKQLHVGNFPHAYPHFPTPRSYLQQHLLAHGPGPQQLHHCLVLLTHIHIFPQPRSYLQRHLLAHGLGPQQLHHCTLSPTQTSTHIHTSPHVVHTCSDTSWRMASGRSSSTTAHRPPHKLPHISTLPHMSFTPAATPPGAWPRGEAAPPPPCPPAVSSAWRIWPTSRAPPTPQSCGPGTDARSSGGRQWERCW